MKTVDYIVKSISPQHGASNVSVNAEIKLLFEHPMHKETVIDDTKIVLMAGKTPVSAKYTYNAMEKVLTIDPGQLKANELYRIKVMEGPNGPQTVFSHFGKRDVIYFFETEDIEKKTEEKPLPGEIEDVEPPIDEQGPEEGKDEEVPLEKEEGSDIVYDPFEDNLDVFSLDDSFPKRGDLVELDSHMVFVFNEQVNIEKVKDKIFVKENKINPLLEDLNKDKLIRGEIKTSNKTEIDNTFLFKPLVSLKPGTEYQVVLSKDIGKGLLENIRINFQTLFERMFADVSTVRLVLGAFADRLTDLDLAKLINQQSNSIYQLASMMDSFNESDWAQENGIIMTFPYAASQYVVYSTAYYAILGRSLEGSSGMSESITLADLSVSGSSDTSDNLADLLELLKAEYERWWDVLQGKPEVIDPDRPNPNYNMAVATRSGGVAPYPEFQTRVPFNELGGEG